MIQPLFNHYWVRVIEILCVYLVLLTFASNFISCLLILNKGYTFDKVIARIWIVTNLSWSVQLYFLVILISKTIGLWHSNDLHLLCGKVCTHCLPSWCNPEAPALVQSRFRGDYCKGMVFSGFQFGLFSLWVALGKVLELPCQS